MYFLKIVAECRCFYVWLLWAMLLEAPYSQNHPGPFPALIPLQHIIQEPYKFVGCFFFVFLCAGWINIDCGASENYIDPVTTIRWVTDTGYINTGVNVEVPNALSSWKGYSELTTIRAFNASRAKNCYALGPLTPNSTYTIRGTFLYGNYDNNATLPTFQVAIGTTVVANVSFIDQYFLRYLEFTLMAMSDTIHYCLLEDQSLSTPFISALTVRPIAQSQVEDWFPSLNGPGWELSNGYIFRTKRRLNFGGNQILRYVSRQLLSHILITYIICRCC